MQLTFQDMERLAMLAGPAVIDNPDIRRGRWSKHPDGYYVRYYPLGYSQTVIQVYVPNSQSSVEFDAADDVAVPANTGAQRLALSNVPYDTTGYPEEPPVVIARLPTPATVPIPAPAPVPHPVPLPIPVPTPTPVPVPTPAPVVTYRTVCGQVIDAQTSKAVAGATVRFADQTLTADAGGRFQLTGVVADQRVDLKAQAGGYQPAELIVLVDAEKECQPVIIPLDLIPKPKPKPADSVVVHNTTLRAGERIVLDNIQFKQTKSNLLPPGQAELDTLTDWLRNRPSLRIELSGHTSNEGDYKANVKLSKERVSACKVYLVRKGIDARRITTVGYGPDRPIASNAKEETAARNRRVELRITQL